MPVVAIVALVASGVITFIWSQQRRLIYFPSAGPVPSASSVLPAGRDVVVETQDGMRLGGWYFPHTSGGSGPAVLVCNGNAGDRSMRAELAVALHGLGLSVLLFDYRGYGGNPGRPSEQGLAADARAAQEWLSGQSDVDPRAHHAVGVGEHPPVQRAIPARDYHPRARRGLQGLAQWAGHVVRDHAGHQQRIGVSGRGDQPRPEPLRVIHRAKGARNLHLTPVARTRVNMSDLQRTPYPGGWFGYRRR